MVITFFDWLLHPFPMWTVEKGRDPKRIMLLSSIMRFGCRCPLFITYDNLECMKATRTVLLYPGFDSERECKDESSERIRRHLLSQTPRFPYLS
jgi:hypothetical protein